MNFYDRRIVLGVLVCALTLAIYGLTTSMIDWQSAEPEHVHHTSAHKTLAPAAAASNMATTRETIPEIVHFIIGASSETSPIKLNFLAFLSIYSAGLHLPDAEIWLHTNASQAMIDQAMSLHGLSPPHYSDTASKSDAGVEIADAEYSEYWTQAVVKGVKHLQIKPITKAQITTSTGKPITKWANWADFVRADVIYEHGGIFLDLDAVVLRDLRPLLRSGYRNILARDGETQCGVIMAAPKSRLMRAYKQLMDDVFDPNLYAFHATSLLHVLRETFVRIPNELLMLSDRAFYPITWNLAHVGAANVETLFSIHKESMAEAAHDIGDLLDFDFDSWIKTYVPPQPGTFSVEGTSGLDLSETYVLHVYHSQFRREVKTGRIKDLTESNPSKLSHGLTLPLVLEGDSHFSRAVLSIVQHAMERSIIGVE